MTCFSLTFNFFDVSLITQVFFFSPSLSVPTQIVFTALLKNFTFLPWQRVHILQPFFFFAIPFLIFFPFFRSFAHFTHWFVWSPSNLTLVLFTFYAVLFPFPLFSPPLWASSYSFFFSSHCTIFSFLIETFYKIRFDRWFFMQQFIHRISQMLPC